MANRPAGRSGCALFLGVLFIVIGSLALLENLFDLFSLSSVRFAARGLSLFGTYWPLLFIAWGLFKVYRRLTSPERASVGAFEVLALGAILVTGLAVSGAQRAMQELSVDLSVDDVASVVGPEILGPLHRFEETSELPLESATVLTVENRRGRVLVRGDDVDRASIRLAKRVHHVSTEEAERAASRVELTTAVSGEGARVAIATGAPERALATDLELVVPRSLSVRVESARGPIRVEGVDGSVTARTSHGRIEIADVAGAVIAETRHADVRLARLGSSATVSTRSGTVDIRDAVGPVEVTGSNGEVTLERVEGRAELHLRQTRLEARELGGDLVVDARYAEVTVEGARGGVRIEASHRPIYVSDALGPVRVTTRNSNVLLREIQGDVVVENRYRTVSLSRVSGGITIRCEQCPVDVHSVEGETSIETSHEPIRVTAFRSGLQVRATHAEIEADTETLGGNVDLETTYGDITLALPESASAQVAVETEDGSFRSTLEARPGGDTAEGPPFRLTLGSGEHQVTARARYGDIRLEGRR